MLKLIDKRRRKYLKEYRSRPEVKEQERQYRKEYNSRPRSFSSTTLSFLF